MAKINPISGKMSGKIGGLVYSVNHGMATVREKNAFPYNPKTEKQISVRAKLKLMSQLSAAMSDVIAFRRNGVVSPRNAFVTANYPLISDPTIVDNEITVVTGLENIDLTGGLGILPDLAQISVSGGVANVSLDSAATDLSAVTYAAFYVKESGNATLIDAKVIETAGAGNNFPATIAIPAGVIGKVIVYAYGSKINTERARVSFEHYKCNTDALQAMLSVVRTFSESDVTLTLTKSAVFTQA